MSFISIMRCGLHWNQ